MKVCGLTIELQLKLNFLSVHKDGGICGVAVKCIDITKNSDCEGPGGSTAGIHRLPCGLPGYLILFDTHAFVLQRQL